MKNKYLLLGTLLALFATRVHAQQGFGTSNPAPSSVVDMVSSNKGALLPRIALSSTGVASPVTSPANALTVFNTATAGDVVPGYYYWSTASSKWIRMVDGVTTNILTATSGNLVSTVNGVASTPAVPVLISASNGLTAASGDVKLGGALTAATTVTTTAANTLALAGLQTGSTADDVMVADATTGVLKKVTQASVALEPWYIFGGTTKASSNTDQIYTTGSWVGIGTNAKSSFADEALRVNGKIRTITSVYADYVFEDYFEGFSDLNKDYKFKSLKETADFIDKNHHLPGVTPINELEKTDKGYSFDISSLTIQNLEKVEELYLHVIGQQKQLDAKDKEIEALRNELKIQSDKTNERLEKLESLLKNK